MRRCTDAGLPLPGSPASLCRPPSRYTRKRGGAGEGAKTTSARVHLLHDSWGRWQYARAEGCHARLTSSGSDSFSAAAATLTTSFPTRKSCTKRRQSPPKLFSWTGSGSGSGTSAKSRRGAPVDIHSSFVTCHSFTPLDDSLNLWSSLVRSLHGTGGISEKGTSVGEPNPSRSTYMTTPPSGPRMQCTRSFLLPVQRRRRSSTAHFETPHYQCFNRIGVRGPIRVVNDIRGATNRNGAVGEQSASSMGTRRILSLRRTLTSDTSAPCHSSRSATAQCLQLAPQVKRQSWSGDHSLFPPGTERL